MTNTSFSSGFGAGLGLGRNREMQRRTDLMQRQQQQEQQQTIRQNLLKNVQDQMKFFADNAAGVSKSISTTTEEGKRQSLISNYDRVIEPMNMDVDRTIDTGVKNGFISATEGEMFKRNIRMAQRLFDPLKEAEAGERMKADVAVAEERAKLPIKKQEASYEHNLEMAQIAERGRQQRLTAQVPRTQRVVQEDPAELANPAVAKIYGLENATNEDLRNMQVFIPEDSKVLRDLIPAKRSYNEVLTNGSKALAIIDRTPDVASLGDAAEFADKVRTVALDLANQLQITMNITPDSAEINDSIRELAGENRELGSIMLSMAYASAIAKGQTGTSLSDKDIVNEIKTVGGDARTQEGRRRALMGFMERVETSYRTRIESTLNRPPPKSPYTMSASELLEVINQKGGWNNLSNEDQAVIRARKEYIEGSQR